MGVCGCGKTTVGRLLARSLGCTFIDGDDLHPTANIRKMAAGTPLTDADRRPWLERVRACIDEARASCRPVVVACSALKTSYRRILGTEATDVLLVFLHGSEELLQERLEARPGHFMPPGLLASQLETLEVPRRCLALDVTAPPDALVEQVLAHLRRA